MQFPPAASSSCWAPRDVDTICPLQRRAPLCPPHEGLEPACVASHYHLKSREQPREVGQNGIENAQRGGGGARAYGCRYAPDRQGVRPALVTRRANRAGVAGWWALKKKGRRSGGGGLAFKEKERRSGAAAYLEQVVVWAGRFHLEPAVEDRLHLMGRAGSRGSGWCSGGRKERGRARGVE
eukprot:scaffold1084_cov114-Isochrysis_galbana.AAC.12